MACVTLLTEEEIEAAVESATIVYNSRYLRCDMSLDEYDAAIAKLAAWAIAQEEQAS